MFRTIGFRFSGTAVSPHKNIHYSKYMNKAKFTEVVTAAGDLKQQVELCYNDLGALANCDSTGTTTSGFGWNLKTAVATIGSEYVDTATVVDGVITITSKNISQGGKSAFTYILKPSPAKQGATDGNASALNWETSDTATCIVADLCFSKKLTAAKAGN